jgi:AmmeMemoRadiSam system protein B
MEALPALRTDIDFLTVRLGEQDVIVVRDPLGIATPNTALTAQVAPYLPLFNGSSTVGDLQIVMMQHQGGSLVLRTEVERIVEDLSRLGILQTDEYREAKGRIVREFSENPERAAALAGSSYPADRKELTTLLDRILTLPASPPDPLPGPPCALVAPHIDLRVAERTYGAAFRSIRSHSPSAILLLGTGHALGENRYCVTDKTFTTPLGRVRAERESIARIREAAGEAIAPDDFAHRNEHSLEFQVLFLQRLFPMEEIPILPVLCGQMEDLFGKVGSPLEVPGMASFVRAVSAWLSEQPDKKLVVAGVDFSHVGPKFGDPHTGRSLEPDFRAYDREILTALAAGDPSAFFLTGARARNRHRICGFSAMWTLLAVLPGIRGTILDYDIWHEDPTRSAVSFAAMAFTPAPSPESLAVAEASSG